MASTKHLQVVMSADAQQLQATLTKTIESFNMMKTAVTSVTSVLSAFGVSFSASEIFSKFEHFNDQIVEFKHSADTLGISIEKIAGLKGAAGSNWEGVQGGITKLLKTMGEAKFGSAEAQKGFDLLGISVSDLEKHIKDGSFLGIVADKLKGIKDPAERAYIMSLLFKKTWADMVPIVQKGSAGIDELTRSADRFGQVTEKSAEEALRAKESIHELSQAWDSLGRTVAVKTVGLSHDLAETAENFRHFQEMTNILKSPEDRQKEVEGHDIRLAHIRGDDKKPEVPITDAMKVATDKAELDAGDKLQLSIQALEDRLRSESDALKGVGHSVEDFARRHADATPKMLALATALEKANNAARKEEELTKKSASVMEHLLTPYEKLKEQIAEVSLLHDKGKLSADQYAMAMGNIGLEIIKLDKEQKQLLQGAGALERGTAGEFSATERFKRERDTDKSNEVAEAAKRQEAELNKIEVNTKNAAAALQKLGVAKF